MSSNAQRSALTSSRAQAAPFRCCSARSIDSKQCEGSRCGMSTPAPGLRRVHGAGLSETAAGRGLAEISKNNPCKAGCSGREPYRSCRRGGTREIPRNNPMQNGALTARAYRDCCGKGARNFEKQPHAKRNAQAAGLAGAAVGRGLAKFRKTTPCKTERSRRSPYRDAAGRGLEISKNNPMQGGMLRPPVLPGPRWEGAREISKNNPMQSTSLKPQPSSEAEGLAEIRGNNPHAKQTPRDRGAVAVHASTHGRGQVGEG
jgi:hypothetical protein